MNLTNRNTPPSPHIIKNIIEKMVGKIIKKK